MSLFPECFRVLDSCVEFKRGRLYVVLTCLEPGVGLEGDVDVVLVGGVRGRVAHGGRANDGWWVYSDGLWGDGWWLVSSVGRPFDEGSGLVAVELCGWWRLGWGVPFGVVGY